MTKFILILSLFPALLMIENARAAVDTSTVKPGWKMLVNKNGWSIQYPDTWQTVDYGGIPTSQKDVSELSGPTKADNNHERFAGVTIQKITYSQQIVEKKNLKDFLEKKGNGHDQATHFVGGHEMRILGEPAYDVIEKHDPIGHGTYPQGAVFRMIAFKHQGVIVRISYSEATNYETPSKSEKDWKYEKVFEEMLSTFKFTK